MTLTRTLTRPVALISMIALAAAMAGCDTQAAPPSSEETGHIGKVGLNLTLPSGKVLNTVSYSITGNGITPRTGTIDVTQAAATISTLVGNIPVGSNYTATLTGTTTDGTQSCLGSATFNVVAGQTTQVPVGLQCRAIAGNTGSAQINGTLNECPTITAFSVQPLAQQVGSAISLSSAATDPNNPMLTYAWAATAAADGTFAAPASASTTFTCALSGTTALTVSVNDGAGCTDSATIQVTCVSAAVCGDSVTGAGEQCDDGNTSNTDACVGTNCRTAVCGDSFVRASVEACDDGNTVQGDGCQNNCTITPPPAGCGNGVVESPEECDDNNQASNDGCSATCLTEACGNNRVDGAEVCDGTVGASGPLGLGQTCAANCLSVTDACRACEVTNCTDYLGAGVDLIAGCYNDPNPTNVQLCVDAIACARVNDCAYTTRGAEQCYCGSASSANCQLGTGVDGACKAQFEAAAGSTSAQFVTGNFGNRSLPIGNAVFMLQCDRDFCDTGSPATGCVP